MLFVVAFLIRATIGYVDGPKMVRSAPSGWCGTVEGPHTCLGLVIPYNIKTKKIEKRCFGIGYYGKPFSKIIF